ncbi:hypothetical protein CDCA_CDCA01G0322 [Cyanidium caldarium]|uniref:Uncharacterized protein n=1 Tax=Cyanidium caldarium TaxID=2771 RepID=A0AAV9IPL6_CYACA|nr:hypothetical protein CDCA_CDCA01G0322 [Cyanidium caldarium]
MGTVGGRSSEWKTESGEADGNRDERRSPSQRLNGSGEWATSAVAALATALVYLVASGRRGARRQQRPSQRWSSPWLAPVLRCLVLALVYRGASIGLRQLRPLVSWLRKQRQRVRGLCGAVHELGDVVQGASSDLRRYVTDAREHAPVPVRVERLLALLDAPPVQRLLAHLVRSAVREASATTTTTTTQRTGDDGSVVGQRRPRGRLRPCAALWTPEKEATVSSAWVASELSTLAPRSSREHWAGTVARALLESGEWGRSVVESVVATAVREAVRQWQQPQPQQQPQQTRRRHQGNGRPAPWLPLLLEFVESDPGKRLVVDSVAAAAAAAIPVLLEEEQEENGMRASSAPTMTMSSSPVSSPRPLQTPPNGPMRRSPTASPVLSNASAVDESATPSRAEWSMRSGGPPTSPFLERLVRLAVREKEWVKEVASAAAGEAVRSYMLTASELQMRQVPPIYARPPDVKSRLDWEMVDGGRGRSDRLPVRPSTAYPGHSSVSSMVALFQHLPTSQLIASFVQRTMIAACTSLHAAAAPLYPPLDRPQWLFW